MARYAIVAEDTDLILDLGPVEDMVTEGVARFAIQFLEDVPYPDTWRTLTVSASAFPLSMGVVDRNSHSSVERTEWLAWKNHLHDGGRVRRIPTYSDCAIQHPSGVEGFDPRIMQAHCEGCASIKAAADGKPRLGSPEVWRRIGTVHHITEVTQALRSLPEP